MRLVALAQAIRIYIDLIFIVCQFAIVHEKKGCNIERFGIGSVLVPFCGRKNEIRAVP